MRTKIAFLFWSTLISLFLSLGIAAFAPYSYVTATTLIKNEGEIRLVLPKQAHDYVQKHNIYEQKCTFQNHANKIHLKYNSVVEKDYVYECYFLSSESIDSGIYKLDLFLGEIKLWMILINAL